MLTLLLFEMISIRLIENIMESIKKTLLIFILTFFSFGNLYVKAAVDSVTVKKNKIELHVNFPYYYLHDRRLKNNFFQLFTAEVSYSRKINNHWSLCGEVKQTAIIHKKEQYLDGNNSIWRNPEKSFLIYGGTYMSALIKRNVRKGIYINLGPSFFAGFPNLNKKHYKDSRIITEKFIWEGLCSWNLGAGFEHTFNNNMTFSINPNASWGKGGMRNLFNDLIDKSLGANNEVRAYFRFDVSLGVGYSF